MALDYRRATTFIAAVPDRKWTAYKDVAKAAGNEQATQAIGNWLRRHGDQVVHVYRVLTIDGSVPDGFVPAGPGVPGDAKTARERLRADGVPMTSAGRAAPRARFRYEDWSEAR